MNNSIIATTYFSIKKHPNNIEDKYVVGRTDNGCVVTEDINYIKSWYDSINTLKLNGLVFYDNLSKNFVDQYTTKFVQFIKVDTSLYSNNDWRFFCYRNYFRNHKYDSIFLTDGSDVVVVQNPSQIIDKYPYIDIFLCKDSVNLNQFPYISLHEQVRWESLLWFLKYQKELPLLNMGVIGGSYTNMLKFLESFCRERIKIGNCDFNADMWLGQYVFRHELRHFNLMVGEPFTSVFKEYQNNRSDVYFIHK